jgi:hypothetical protein
MRTHKAIIRIAGWYWAFESHSRDELIASIETAIAGRSVYSHRRRQRNN